MRIKELLRIFIVQIYFEFSICQNLEKDSNLWPYPHSISRTPDYYLLDDTKFQFIPKLSGKCDILDKAFNRYKQLMFLQDCSQLKPSARIPNIKTKKLFATDTHYIGVLENITVEVLACEQWPHINMDESYTINISLNHDAILRAKTNWGAMRALETLSQLVKHVGLDQFVLSITHVDDSPRFRHRGVMLDTARHFIPLHVLFDNLDAMAYNKFNVFHWHIVDDQSFPYVSKTFPDLSLNGSFDSETHVYSGDDVKAVIEYARERAIRVVVEFDTPGHTQCWAKGQPNLLTECYASGKPNGQFGPIDPTRNTTYSFISQLFAEIADTFPDHYLHLGGDEVNFDCWRSNPIITEFMLQKQFANNYAKLEEHYMQQVLNIVSALNRSYIVWEEVFNNGADIKADTVVHVWKGTGLSASDATIWRKELFNVTDKGFQALLSSCWYLNHVAYGSDWHPYYECEPLSFNGTDRQNGLVLGGEACIWGEWVDGSNLISRLWPRAATAAERLWSEKKFDKAVNAVTRFERHRCDLQLRGLRVQPGEGPGFCKCDYAV